MRLVLLFCESSPVISQRFPLVHHLFTPLSPVKHSNTTQAIKCIAGFCNVTVEMSSAVRKFSNQPENKKTTGYFYCAVGAWKVGSTFLGILISRRQIEMLLRVPLGNLRMRRKYTAATREQETES